MCDYWLERCHFTLKWWVVSLTEQHWAKNLNQSEALAKIGHKKMFTVVHSVFLGFLNELICWFVPISFCDSCAAPHHAIVKVKWAPVYCFIAIGYINSNFMWPFLCRFILMRFAWKIILSIKTKTKQNLSKDILAVTFLALLDFGLFCPVIVSFFGKQQRFAVSIQPVHSFCVEFPKERKQLAL